MDFPLPCQSDHKKMKDGRFRQKKTMPIDLIDQNLKVGCLIYNMYRFTNTKEIITQHQAGIGKETVTEQSYFCQILSSDQLYYLLHPQSRKYPTQKQKVMKSPIRIKIARCGKEQLQRLKLHLHTALGIEKSYGMG